MSALVRQGHFLGAKLRSLRKRNGLTLEELSARCVQIDATAAPYTSSIRWRDWARKNSGGCCTRSPWSRASAA